MASFFNLCGAPHPKHSIRDPGGLSHTLSQEQNAFIQQEPKFSGHGQAVLQITSSGLKFCLAAFFFST